MNDVTMMTAAVASNPADTVAQLVLADAITEQTGDYEGAVRDAKRVAVRVKIAEYVAFMDRASAENYARNGYTFAPAPTHRADFISPKWCRIVRVEKNADGSDAKGQSVACFVCLQDGYTKTMGYVECGGVYKADGWKRAAKHARGSVYAEDYSTFAGAHGVAYLR